MTDSSDQAFMALALDLARESGEAGEVPIGAVIVLGQEVIGRGRNQPISACDPTAHAEIQALREASRSVGNYRLPGATLYVTLEPCVMCVGALVHARISRLVFGATEPKAGAVCSQSHLLDAHPFNWAVAWQGGVLAEACSQTLSDFFRQRRLQKQAVLESGLEKPDFNEYKSRG